MQTTQTKSKTGPYKHRNTESLILIFKDNVFGDLCYRNNRFEGVITFPEDVDKDYVRLNEEEIAKRHEEISKLEQRVF